MNIEACFKPRVSAIFKMYFQLTVKNYIFIFICLAVIKPVYSQPESAKPGYVITQNNDTIPGNIKIPKENRYQMNIKMWDAAGKKRTYRADRIKGFYYDSRCFESLVLEGSHYFFEKIINGRVSLYQNIYGVASAPYPMGGIVLTSLSAGDVRDYFIVEKSKLIVPKRIDFRKFMMKYIKNCPALSGKIDKQELKYDDLKQIIEEYNLCDADK